MNISTKQVIVAIAFVLLKYLLNALIIGASGYVVFCLDRSVWVFLWTAIMLIIVNEYLQMYAPELDEKKICDDCRSKFTIKNNYCDYGYNTQNRVICDHFEPLWTDNSKKGRVETAKEDTEVKADYKINFPIFQFPPSCGNCSHTKSGGLFLYCDKGHERQKQFDSSTFSCDDYERIASSNMPECVACRYFTVRDNCGYCVKRNIWRNGAMTICDAYGPATVSASIKQSPTKNLVETTEKPQESEKKEKKRCSDCKFIISNQDGIYCQLDWDDISDDFPACTAFRERSEEEEEVEPQASEKKETPTKNLVETTEKPQVSEKEKKNYCANCLFCEVDEDGAKCSLDFWQVISGGEDACELFKPLGSKNEEPQASEKEEKSLNQNICGSCLHLEEGMVWSTTDPTVNAGDKVYSCQIKGKLIKTTSLACVEFTQWHKEKL